jgi:hypothetical protein
MGKGKKKKEFKIIKIIFLRFNYKGNLLEEHLKVARGTLGFRGTQFERHWPTSFW